MIHITSEYLGHEAKAVSTGSKVEVLEAENAKLKRDLISAMDKANTAKEKTKALADDLEVEKQLTVEKDKQLQAKSQKVKAVAANAVQAFQQTEEYNTVLFSQYYKGFELLRRYFVKHPFGVDLENLDFKVVDKEMEIDVASQATAAVPKENAPGGNGREPENAPIDATGGDEVAI